MFKYSIELKQVIAVGGISVLDETRKAIFYHAINLIASLLKNSEEISNVEVLPDYSILVTATKDVEAELQKLQQTTIIKRI